MTAHSSNNDTNNPAAKILAETPNMDTVFVIVFAFVCQVLVVGVSCVSLFLCICSSVLDSLHLKHRYRLDRADGLSLGEFDC